MKNTIYVQAWDYTVDELQELVIDSDVREINFIWQLEWELVISNRLVEHINKNRIKVNLVTCLGDPTWLMNNTISRGIDRRLLHCETWPGFWFLKSHHNMISEKQNLYPDLDNSTYKFDRPFISLNGKWRPYRSKLINELIKNDYLNKGLVSYHREYKRVDATESFEHYRGERLSIGDAYETLGSSYSFDERYISSFLHIPTESTIQAFILSEKTAMPILCKKPFLTLGCYRYHEKLERILGIEPYTEIFDYSFDQELDLSKRIEKMLVNVKFLIDNQHRLTELYDMIRDKVERNYKRAMRYIQTYNLCPPMIQKYYRHISNPATRVGGFDIELLEMSKYFKDKQIPNATSSRYRVSKIYYDLWDNFSFEKIVSDLKEQRPEKIVILGENEWDPWFTDEFVKVFNESDTQLLYLTGAKESEYTQSKFTKAGLKGNYKIQYWPTFWFNCTEMTLSLESTIDHRTFVPSETFKYPFISLNNRGHVHRLLYLDEMAGRDLLDKGIVTWHDIHNENKHVELKHFDRETRLKIDDDFDTKLSSFIIPQQYHDSFFNFATECCNETIMFSEKTGIPVLLKKPFAILGAPHYHAYLQELGFELYDEIIDYSFDSVIDLKDRVKLYVDNIECVSKLDNLDEMYQLLKPKLEYNYENYFRVMNDIERFPPEVRTIIYTTPQNENIPVSNHQRKYRQILERMKR